MSVVPTRTTKPVPTPEQQTLAAGKTIAQQYDPRISMLGFSDVQMIPDPSQMFWLLGGRSGEGKSSFLQSCSGALIFNVDGTSTTLPGRKAAARMWPGINPRTGHTVEPNPEAPGDPTRGIPVQVTWAKLIEKKQELIQLAEMDMPGRPKMVAIDSLDRTIPLVQAWLADQAGVENFDKLHGKTAWPDLRAQLVEFAFDLRRAGYGFCYTIQLGDKTIWLNEGNKEYLRDVPLMPDNLWHEVKQFAEMVACVEIVKTTKTENRPQIDPVTKKPRMNAAGQPITMPAVIPITDVFLTFVSEKMHGTAKKRGDLPDRIKLGKTGMWDAFAKVYADSSKSLAAESDVS